MSRGRGPGDEATDPLLEREGERAVLTGALTAASQGAGSVVLIEGPSGIGKSRLLSLVKRQADAAGMAVLAAGGVEFERDAPFGAAVRLFRSSLTGIGEAGRRRLVAGPAAVAARLVDSTAAEADPDALVRGLYWLTVNLTARATAAARLMVVDDAQWVDLPSLRFLAHLAVRVEELPLALVVTVNTSEPSGSDAVLDRLRLRAGVRVLRPAPLTTAAVGRLVRARFQHADPQFVATCARVSGGNPFLARELVWTLDAEGVAPTAESISTVERLVPDRVLNSVLVRLARLPERASRLAAAVAVLGDDAPLRTAAALAGLEAEPAEEAADMLAATAILKPGEPLRFAHSLIAGAVYRNLPDFARSRAHRRAAHLLAADEPGSDQVAAHLLVTRPEGDAGTVRSLRAAAQRALTRGDPAAAVHLLERAIREPPAGEERAALLLELADAQLHHADPHAEDTIRQALDLSDEVTSRGRALYALFKLHSVQGDYDRAERVAQQALALLEPGEPLAQTLLVDQLTPGTFRARLSPTAATHLAPMLRATRAGNPPRHPGLLAHLALRLAFEGAPAAQIRDLAGRATATEPLVDPAGHGFLAGVLVQALATVDELDAAERLADQALEAARRRGSLLAYATASFHRAIPRYHRGALTEALADLEQALTASREGWSGGDCWIRSLQAQILLECGDQPGAAEVLGLAPPPPPGSMDHAVVLLARADLALAARDDEAALSAALAAGEYLRDGFGIDHPGLLPWRRTASLAAAALGRRGESRRLARESLAPATHRAVPRAEGMALHSAALVGADDDRIPRLRAAVAILEQSPSKLRLAHALVDLGAALARSGQPTPARPPLRRGLDLADRMGAAPLATAARQALHLTGARPRRSAISGAAALTPTERRVADLATKGLTNPQIAQTLFITTKTVQTHLTSAYRKLGIRTRGQLSDALTGPVPS